MPCLHESAPSHRSTRPWRAEDALGRRLLTEKYGPRYAADLGDWGRTALPVAFDLRV